MSDADQSSTEPADALGPASLARGAQRTGWSANSYSAIEEEEEEEECDPSSPTSVAAGSRDSTELLRRLSLLDVDRPVTPQSHPQAVYPSLGLSGRVISATICIPHSLGFGDGHWVG